MKRIVIASWFGLYALGCGDCGIPEESAVTDEAGAIETVFADHLLTCEEHFARNQYNVCPQSPPLIGTDADGTTWIADWLIFGLFGNPYHPGLDCFRGTSAELGASSYQCCYDGDQLVDEGPTGSSFDFFDPARCLIEHVLYDILPEENCNNP